MQLYLFFAGDAIGPKSENELYGTKPLEALAL